MIKKILIAGLLSIAASFSWTSTSHALPVDIIDNGSYTTDTISGLDWLDLSFSENMNYNYVQSQLVSGGLFDGWRYANNTDFAGLLNNWTGTSIADVSFDTWTFPNTGVPGTSHGLTTLLGDESDIFAIGMLDEPTGSGGHYLGELYDIDDSPFPYHEAYINQVHHQDDATYFISDGAYLVRVSVIPLPASVWMFGSVLVGIGLFGLRRKQIT